MNKKIVDIYNDAKGLNDEDLRKLADSLYAEVKARMDKASIRASLEFSVGQLVVLKNDEGRLPKGVVGKIEKINSKTITVDFGVYRKWRMYGTAIEAAPAGAKFEPKKGLFAHEEF